MKFTDFLSREVICVPLQAHDKEGVIREMVQVLVDAGRLEPEQFESVVRAVLKREKLGSTGIGCGVAVPGDFCCGLGHDRLLVALGVSHEGVEFESLDDENARVFFLLLGAPDRPRALCAVETISRQLRNHTWLAHLQNVKTPEEGWQLLEEADGNRCDR